MKLSKKIIANAFLALILVVLFMLGKSVSTSHAQVPNPYVPCDSVRSNEFHSLRPYQKSPCNTSVSQTALFCGNQLVVSDGISVVQAISPPSAENCEEERPGIFRCTYTTTQTKNIAIDLSNASLPVLGNTEDVVNVSNQTDYLDDGDKTNQFVSWYLNGVSSPSEYGYLDPEDEEDLSKIIDFSGPINKLMPRRILDDKRVETINEAGTSRHDQIVGCVNLVGQITECSSFGAKPVRISDFENHQPPKIEDDQYQDFQDYWIAYERWRGQSCLTLPIVGVSVCIDNPLKSNYWGNLFAEIPLSSTEDRTGLVRTETVGVQPVSEDIEIADVSFSNQEPAELFFSHTEEVTELARFLQSTYISADGDWSGTAFTGISPTDYCDLVNIRSGPGDDLFAGEISGDLTYTAKFSCLYGSGSINSGETLSCEKNVAASLSLLTETPKADEAWSRLVAGPSGIFKRIFPKIGEGGAILGLLDIPGATKVTYSGDGLVYAGNPGNERSGESAELYFPHIGGISEYFLKGIQTMLRPKGYGEQIISGAPGTFPSSGDVDCNQDAPEVNLKGTLDKQETFELALRWVSGQPGNHVLECYNDVVKRSEEAGINPALSLWVWLHESNASNYNISIEDFGVHFDQPQGFVNQINGYLARAKSYTPDHPLCAGYDVTPLEAFANIYAYGSCEPVQEEVNCQNPIGWYSELACQWSWISPGCPLPSSPTDLSCP